MFLPDWCGLFFLRAAKICHNSLRPIFPQLGGEANVMAALETLGLDPQQRGETLSPTEFYALAEYCGKNLNGLPKT